MARYGFHSHELPRKRCQNCPKFFWPTRTDQRFCCATCRKQYHHFGAAYGPLRDKLFAEIDRRARETEARLKIELSRDLDMLFKLNAGVRA